jgi:hypothetical protein
MSVRSHACDAPAELTNRVTAGTSISATAADIECETAALRVGERSIIGVAFSDEDGSGFAVLESGSAGTRLVYTIREADMPEFKPHLRTEDLNGDGVVEMVASFMDAQFQSREFVFDVRSRSDPPSDRERDVALCAGRTFRARLLRHRW